MREFNAAFFREVYPVAYAPFGITKAAAFQHWVLCNIHDIICDEFGGPLTDNPDGDDSERWKRGDN